MVKKFIYLFTFLIFSISNCQDVFYGSIELDMSSKDVPKFCICFDGCCIQVENCNYLVKSNFELDSINFLITDCENNLYHEISKENKVVTWKLRDTSKVVFFNLKKNSNKYDFRWDIRKEECKKEVPLHTIIFPIDAKDLSFKLKNVKTTKNNSSQLPKLKIIGDKSTLKKRILRSCLSILDLKPFHSRPKTNKLETDNLVIKTVE